MHWCECVYLSKAGSSLQKAAASYGVVRCFRGESEPSASINEEDMDDRLRLRERRRCLARSDRQGTMATGGTTGVSPDCSSPSSGTASGTGVGRLVTKMNGLPPIVTEPSSKTQSGVAVEKMEDDRWEARVRSSSNPALGYRCSRTSESIKV